MLNASSSTDVPVGGRIPNLPHIRDALLFICVTNYFTAKPTYSKLLTCQVVDVYLISIGIHSLWYEYVFFLFVKIKSYNTYL